jgi:glyoxylase-like metal-dependent hydrolase (beta-lactamase superfamily II)
MPHFPELERVGSHAALWHTYDHSVKADLFSTAIHNDTSTCLVDPIKPNRRDLEELHATKPIQAIVVTNQNHWRASSELSRHFSVPIFAHADASLEQTDQPFTSVDDEYAICEGLSVITIDGAVPGEIVLLSSVDAGALIVGDTLINCEPYGFTFLPPKYCADHKTMRRSLRRLLHHDFQTIYFAHGVPILYRARSRLQTLLNSE